MINIFKKRIKKIQRMDQLKQLQRNYDELNKKYICSQEESVKYNLMLNELAKPIKQLCQVIDKYEKNK